MIRENLGSRINLTILDLTLSKLAVEKTRQDAGAPISSPSFGENFYGPLSFISTRCALCCPSGGFEHVVQLINLQGLVIDGFWEAFEDLPTEVATESLQEKLEYLRGRLEDAAGPLL